MYPSFENLDSLLFYFRTSIVFFKVIEHGKYDDGLDVKEGEISTKVMT